MKKKLLYKKKFWVKKILGKKFWIKKIFGQEDFCQKMFFSKKNQSGRVNPRGRMCDPPLPKIVGLKLSWIVVSFVRWGRIQNFRPLGPLFLVEVEFVVGWWWVWTAIIVSNPTSGWGYVELWLGWGFDKILAVNYWQIWILSTSLILHAKCHQFLCVKIFVWKWQYFFYGINIQWPKAGNHILSQFVLLTLNFILIVKCSHGFEHHHFHATELTMKL